MLKSARLYVILDAQVNSYPELFEIALRADRAGADILQLRDKRGTARDILMFSRKLKAKLSKRVLYIMNDRADLVLASDADGVHVGQDDLPVGSARRLLGRGRLVGLSCQTYAHAKQAARLGADYIGLGSVFRTRTKPDREPMDTRVLRQVCAKIPLPVFPIGGLDVPRVRWLRDTCGIRRAAVCRDICLARNVEARVREFRDVLEARKDIN